MGAEVKEEWRRWTTLEGKNWGASRRYVSQRSRAGILTYLYQVPDDLQDRHRLSIPQEVTVKKEVAADILLVFTDRKVVKFIKANNTVDEVKGRWCHLCR